MLLKIFNGMEAFQVLLLCHLILFNTSHIHRHFYGQYLDSYSLSQMEVIFYGVDGTVKK